MKLAFTHNLQISTSEEEAEFDRVETVQALAAAMVSLGHEVELVEVTGPASRLVSRLEALNPDLIFNTAIGRSGRYRQAFYPALFEQLGIPYTGSDAYVCSLTRDKQLTKMMMQGHGIPTPRWYFIDSWQDFVPPDLIYPVIVKPNFEGASKGITVDSVLEEPARVREQVRALLARYPAGVLIEEFVVGKDVVVPFLERSSPKTGGVLVPAEYAFNPRMTRGRKHRIYDYELQNRADGVQAKAPAELGFEATADLIRTARRIYRMLGVHDLGRLDFRVAPDGRAYFIEANALPSLEPGATLYEAAHLAGMHDTPAVVDAIIRSAAERYGLKLTRGKTRKKRAPVRVGLVYNLKRVKPEIDGEKDQEAEFDSPKTVQAIHDAIASYGHEVIDIEANTELGTELGTTPVDVVFNVAEGMHGRNREAHVPAICELMQIPYTGSDPATLSIALDKALAKRFVRNHGIGTPDFFLMRTGKERLPKDLRFPLIVKPVAEGSSKGVFAASVVENEAELRELARDVAGRYKQPALVEEFLTGREFTVGLLGETRPRVLPPMEIVFLDPENKRPVYTFAHKQDWNTEIRYDHPAILDPHLARELERAARGSFAALGCRDVARIDFRLDARGRVNFIECNPLPGLSPGWSDLCLISESAGMDYRTLIGEILAPALRRFREKERAARGRDERRAPQPVPPSASQDQGSLDLA
jgi:D-alanine-D-alanine ligase